MARGKNLTRRMKKYVSEKMRLNAEEWVYTKNTNTEFVIVNKFTGTTRIIDKITTNITIF